MEDTAIVHVLASELRRCLALLPAEERALIHALYYEELTEREYADKIKLSQKGVNKRHHKILRKLRSMMKAK